MLTWLRKWLSTADTSPPAAKRSGGRGMMSAIGPGTVGPTTPVWNETHTRQLNAEWVFAAVRAIAGRISAQPVRVGKKTKAKRVPGQKTPAADAAASGADVRELPAHPLSEVIDHPNAYTTESMLVHLVVSALQIAGTAYIWVDDEGDRLRLWYVPSGWVYEDKDAPVPLSRFTIRPEGSADSFDVTSDELIRIAIPDPANPFQALSPLRAAYRSILTDREIQTSQNSTFSNGGRPGLLVKVGGEPEDSGIGDKDAAPTLTRDQRLSLRRLVKEATSGAANAGEPVILDAFIREVEPFTRTAAEMDFLNSALGVRDRILGIFGVPEVVLGINDNANRASAVVADETFCYGTCAPIVRLVNDQLTAFFRVWYSDPDLCVWIEAPKPRDPDARRADMDQMIRAGCVKLDEVRAWHGLPPLPNGKGDVLVKVGGAAPPAGQTPPSKPESSDGHKGGDLPAPGWASGSGLWKYLDDEQKLAVFKRHSAGKNGKRITE